MKIQNNVVVKNITISNALPFTLIAGPCQLESRDHAMEMVQALTEYTKKLNIPFIYKTSFDKANRTSATSPRGLGLKNAIPIFQEISERFDCPLLTDVHNVEQCDLIAPYVDILQIPAFLSRQTDLLEAAAKTNKVINIKKGQFLAPWDMKNIVAKMEYFGNNQLLLTDRGVCFGYNTLVSDMRALPIMAETGCPVIFDATHSVQKPGGSVTSSGGERKYVFSLARAAIATGVGGVFMETHQDPDKAPSDGPCMVVLKNIPYILSSLQAIDAITKSLTLT